MKLCLAALLSPGWFGARGQKRAYKQTLKLMGSRFEITAISEDETLTHQNIAKAIDEITRIERLISS